MGDGADGDAHVGSASRLREGPWSRVRCGAISSGLGDVGALPDILYVGEFAALLRISPKALRQRAARGQVPAPFKLGKALAWTRGSVLAWLRDCSRSARSAEMKINLRPYAHDKSRWHVDIRIMHPCEPEREIRKRLVAPARLSKAEARSWGEQQVPKILSKVLGRPVDVDAVGGASPSRVTTREDTRGSGPASAHANTRRRGARAADVGEGGRLGELIHLDEARREAMTLAEFYAHRFDPEHVSLQKPATQASYEKNYRVHIRPLLGELPVAAIDEGHLSMFRAALRRRLGVRTANLVLTHLATMLRFAKKVRLIREVPEVEKLRVPRAEPKEVYSVEEIAALLEAAAGIDPKCELICLLALDAGLRSSEICALEWDDVDLKAGSILVRHNEWCGIRQSPKGTIGRIALTSALRRSLEAHRRREPIGPLVVYRRNAKTGNEWRPHTPSSIRYRLNLAQRRAGLSDTGPHLLRHTMLTRLANLGASVHVLQAVARHSRLQTTQAYIHTQQAGLAREAAELLDQAAADSGGLGKNQANRAKARKR